MWLFDYAKSFWKNIPLNNNYSLEECFNCKECKDKGIIYFSDKPGGKKIASFCKCKLNPS